MSDPHYGDKQILNVKSHRNFSHYIYLAHWHGNIVALRNASVKDFHEPDPESTQDSSSGMDLLYLTKSSLTCLNDKFLPGVLVNN